jgi:hypothetical protein
MAAPWNRTFSKLKISGPAVTVWRPLNLTFYLLPFTLLFFVFLLTMAGCQKNSSQGGSSIDVFGITDQTGEAGQIIQDANEDLKKIKKMYKENSDRVDDLKAAMKANNVDKVKSITDDLVYIINDGTTLGETAIGKIQKAEEMNINEQYKNYLQLKEECLRKQLDAFEFRRQAARVIRDSFGTRDPKQIERAKIDFKDNEDNFQRNMEVAREMSEQANQLAKQSVNLQSN